MDIASYVRAVALGMARIVTRTLVGMRVAWLRTGSALRDLPDTIYEQIRQWRWLSYVLPVDEQRRLLAEFYDKFEQLSDTICDAGYAGEGAPFQERYSELRKWLMRAYPLLKPYLTAHLNHDPSDAEFGLRTVGRPTDALEALFFAESLDTVLELDGGHLIGRLERARSALYRYADYLRDIILE